jgi:hypothetical protein
MPDNQICQASGFALARMQVCAHFASRSDGKGKDNACNAISPAAAVGSPTEY